MTGHVAIWDPNPFNPYGAELARSLASGNMKVTRYGRVGMSYPWPGVREELTLPAPAQGSRSLRTLSRYVFSVTRSMARLGLNRSATILVSWTNSSIERFFLLILAYSGSRILLVEHNPVPSRDRASRFSLARALRRRAKRLVVHSEKLADSLSKLEPSRRLDIAVAPHPLYIAWRARHLATAEASKSGERKYVVFAGSVRSDKGIADLPAIAEDLPASIELELAVGFVGSSIREHLSQSENIRFRGNGDSYLPDSEFFASIDSASALVAPYTDVTASGTVMMALTVNTPVIAYESTALERLPGQVEQVPTGDTHAMAQVCLSLIANSAEKRVYDQSAYDETSSSAWIAAIERPGEEN